MLPSSVRRAFFVPGMGPVRPTVSTKPLIESEVDARRAVEVNVAQGFFRAQSSDPFREPSAGSQAEKTPPAQEAPAAAPAPAQGGSGGGKGRPKKRGFAWGRFALLGAAGYVTYSYLQDPRARAYPYVILPAIFKLSERDPEIAHEWAIRALSAGLTPKDTLDDDTLLGVRLFGRSLSNPLGLAAGFDKNAEAVDGLLDLGFSYVEVGSVTPLPQPGNPKPRLFRLGDGASIINRYGFNSVGGAAVLDNLAKRMRVFVRENGALVPSVLFDNVPDDLVIGSAGAAVDTLIDFDRLNVPSLVDALDVPRSLRENKMLAVNLGKNKASAQSSVSDFVQGVRNFGPYADVLVVNISSPNTPGLRDLQNAQAVETLIKETVQARNELPDWHFPSSGISAPAVRPPLLVKLTVDLADSDLEAIASAALVYGADGLIISNTTITRPEPFASVKNGSQQGGLSGPALKPKVLHALEVLRTSTAGQLPLIACGGVSSGQDVYEYGLAGASLVQLYTGFIYGGPGTARRIKDELVEVLRANHVSWEGLVRATAAEAYALHDLTRAHAKNNDSY